MWNKGNQIYNFFSSSGTGTVINYGSDFLTSYGYGSASQKFRFRFHNTVVSKELFTVPAGKEVNRTAAASHREQLTVRRHLKGLTVGSARSSSPTRSFHSTVPAYLVTKLSFEKITISANYGTHHNCEIFLSNTNFAIKSKLFQNLFWRLLWRLPCKIKLFNFFPQKKFLGNWCQDTKCGYVTFNCFKK